MHPPVKVRWNGLLAGADNLLPPGERRFNRLLKTHSAVVLGSKSSSDFQKRPGSRVLARDRTDFLALHASPGKFPTFSAAMFRGLRWSRGRLSGETTSGALQADHFLRLACRNPSGKPSCARGGAVCCLSCTKSPLAGRRGFQVGVGAEIRPNPAINLPISDHSKVRFSNFQSIDMRLQNFFQQPARR